LAKAGVDVAGRTARRTINLSTGCSFSRGPRRRSAEILEAAVRVFYKRGYSGATVQNIADELGILKGSLYYYIDTKEDLLFQLIEEVHTQVQRILDEVQAEDGLEPLRRLELYVRRQVEYNIDNFERITVYYHDLDRLTGCRLRYVESARQLHDNYVASLITEAQKEGKANESYDARMMAGCVFGTIIWSYQWAHGASTSAACAADTCTLYVLGRAFN
jgi:AcrR family transcriptional regulator